MKSFINIMLLITTCFVMTSAKLDTCCSENVQKETKLSSVEHAHDCHDKSTDQEKKEHTDCNMDCCHSLVTTFNKVTVASFIKSIKYKYVLISKKQTKQYHPKLYRPPIS